MSGATVAPADPGLPTVPRVALLLVGAVALIAGLSGALLLEGVTMPAGTGRLAAGHGLLMTLGFLGTLVALERAVALGRPWAYASPLLSGAGGLAIVAGVPMALAAIPLALGATVLLWIYAVFARVHPTFHLAVQAGGAGGWFVAALLLRAGTPVAGVMPWLAAFLILTVLGERLELSGLFSSTRVARRVFTAAAAIFVLGVVASLAVAGPGVHIAGLGLTGLALWGARFDLARRTVRSRGVTRFIAACLLAGYAWLGVGGVAWALLGATSAGPGYDVSVHAVFLGFVISMVFGHAPVILPGVLRLPLPYHRAFYGHLGLLHAGLIIRVLVGDLLQVDGAARLGGILNVLAVLLFLVVSATAATHGALRRRASGGRTSGGRAAGRRRRPGGADQS